MEDCKTVDRVYPQFRCQLRVCEFCYWRESKRIYKRYANKLHDYVDGGFRLAILTLTIPNLSHISSQDYDRLFQKLKKLFQDNGVKIYLIGGLAKIETTYNADRQEFHPHIHIIIVYTDCISQKEIKPIWEALTAATDDYELSDTPLHHSSKRSVRFEEIEFNENDPASISRAIKKVLNYICKFNPIADPDAFASIYCATKGKRLIRAYGGLRNRLRRIS